MFTYIHIYKLCPSKVPKTTIIRYPYIVLGCRVYVQMSLYVQNVRLCGACVKLIFTKAAVKLEL